MPDLGDLQERRRLLAEAMSALMRGTASPQLSAANRLTSYRGDGGVPVSREAWEAEQADPHAAGYGVSIIPVRPDGSKAPAVPTWKEFRTRRAQLDELYRWFADGRAGVGVVCGEASGGLIVLDFEDIEAFSRWVEIVGAARPDLAARIDQLPAVDTPGGGVHLYVRVADGPVPAGSKLAYRQTDDGLELAAETRGEGHYVVAPGSPAACHQTGKPYAWRRPPQAAGFPRLPRANLDALLSAMAALDERPKVEAQARSYRPPEPTAGDGNRPGDDYNRRTDPVEYLRGRGWKIDHVRGEVTFMIRPGKRGGVSASVGRCKTAGGLPRVYVFTSNAAPLLAGESYDAFGLYAEYECGGDRIEAARRLGEQGFGEQSQEVDWSGTKRAAPEWQPGGGSAGPADWPEPIPFGRSAAPPAFPIDVLPEWWADFVGGVAHGTQTPPDAAGMLSLAAVAGGIGGKVRYQIRDGWSKNANLYAVVAMEPGERKSAVFKDVFGPVSEVQRDLAEAARLDIAQAKAAHGTREATLKELQRQAAKADDPARREELGRQIRDMAEEIERNPVPALPTLIVDDESLESLTNTLIEQDGRLLQAGPEGTAFEIAGGRYSDDENFDVYLKAHDGDPLRVGRVSRGRSGCESPCLTCGLAVQPDVLRCLGQSSKARGRGFLARWLYAVPDRRVGSRLIRALPASAAVIVTYKRVLMDLWRVDIPQPPMSLRFTRQADDALAEFEEKLEPRLGADGDLAGLASWGSKLPGEVARIAGNLHLAAAAHRGDLMKFEYVPKSAVEAAVRLADDYLIHHARLAFAVMAADPAESLAVRARDWLLRRPNVVGFTWTQLFQGLKSGKSDLKSADLDPAISILAAHNYIAEVPTRGKGKRYAVNPRWDRAAGRPPEWDD